MAKHLRTEKEYERALERVANLMDAEPDSPEEANLNRLVDKIVEYEKAQFFNNEGEWR